MPMTQMQSPPPQTNYAIPIPTAFLPAGDDSARQAMQATPRVVNLYPGREEVATPHMHQDTLAMVAIHITLKRRIVTENQLISIGIHL